MEGQILDWFFPFLRTNTQQTQRKGKEREGRKKKMYAGGRLTYFVAVQSGCGKGGGGGAGIHKNGHHLSELA